MKKVSILLLAVLIAILLSHSALAEIVFAFEDVEYNVSVNKSIDLKPILQGAELSKQAKYSWESENSSIAKVSNAGRVTGVSAGQTVIKVTVKDTNDTSYSTSCIVNVIQPVTKISFEKEGLKVPYGVEIKLEPKVSPENATNKKLRFTSSDPSICKVSEDGVIKGLTSNESAYITAEATDGSGAKAKLRVNVRTFVIDEDEIVLTERKTYQLVLDYLDYDGYYLKYNRNGAVKLGNLNVNQNDWYTIGMMDITDEKTGKKIRKEVLEIEPVKTGSQTITIYDLSGTWRSGFTKETIKITVKPTAVYGDSAFPAIQYAKVTADPSSYIGKGVSFSGSIYAADKKDDGIIQYSVATKGSSDNIVIARVPKEFTKFANFNVGEKVKIYGVWQDPETTTTGTGLTVTKPVLQIEKVNDLIFNSELKQQKAQ